MDVREKYVMQKVNQKEKSICPNCIHHNLCIAENNQPCFECNRFIDAHGVTVQEWISVSERLPQNFVSVLGYMTDAGEFPPVRECYTVGNAFFFPALGDVHPVSHWCETPQPPKGE
jgi:hypothetical protein